MLRLRLAKVSCVYVRADNQRLKQVLLNLLSNGIKYNRPGGRLTVTADTPAPGRVRLSVTDTGHGMSAEQLTRAFEPFDRLGAERSSVEGTGLGLALAKSLVEAMHGTIEVESQIDAGTSFTVELPLADAPTSNSRSSETPRIATAVEIGATGPVLYIEDNPSNIRLVEQVLARRPQTELLIAMDGQLGLDLAHSHHPSVILLDLHLPGIDGIEVLARLKQDPTTRAIPVVVLSADISAGQTTRLFALGAHDFVAKPIDVSHLMEVLDASLMLNLEPAQIDRIPCLPDSPQPIAVRTGRKTAPR